MIRAGCTCLVVGLVKTPSTSKRRAILGAFVFMLKVYSIVVQ